MRWLHKKVAGDLYNSFEICTFCNNRADYALQPIIVEYQYWLAELDVHGNPTLVDGAHDAVSGVHRAMELYKALGFAKNRKFAIAKVYLEKID
jgi:hypothetical protein